MKGWRPSANQRLEPDRALFKRTYSCRTSDRSACLFLPSSVGGEVPPCSRSIRLAVARSAKWRPSVRDRNGASPSLATGDRRAETKTKERRTARDTQATPSLPRAIRQCVIPANAGIQSSRRDRCFLAALRSRSWMPACASMTRLAVTKGPAGRQTWGSAQVIEKLRFDEGKRGV